MDGGPIAGRVVVAARGRWVLSVAMRSGNKPEKEEEEWYDISTDELL